MVNTEQSMYFQTQTEQKESFVGNSLAQNMSNREGKSKNNIYKRGFRQMSKVGIQTPHRRLSTSPIQQIPSQKILPPLSADPKKKIVRKNSIELYKKKTKKRKSSVARKAKQVTHKQNLCDEIIQIPQRNYLMEIRQKRKKKGGSIGSASFIVNQQGNKSGSQLFKSLMNFNLDNQIQALNSRVPQEGGGRRQKRNGDLVGIIKGEVKKNRKLKVSFHIPD